jgi:LysR family transcriptional regulator, nitrogen assimilation regulatory protein
MPLTLKQLRYFFHVVETGSITRASQSLNVAQTALGLQIRALEQEMGLPLLQRHARGVTPTEAGQLLYRDGVAFMARLRDLEHRIKSLRTNEIDIRIGLPPSISTMIGPEMIAADPAKISGIRLQIVETVSRSLMEQLGGNQIDCAFIQELEPIPDTTNFPVFEQRLTLVTPPGDGLKNTPISFRNALNFPLAFGPNSTSARIVRALAEQLGLSIDMRYPVDSISAAKGMVLRGLSASIVPFELVALEAAQGLLDAREIVDPQLKLTTSFVCANRVANSHAGRALFGFLDGLISQACATQGSRTVHLGNILTRLG